MIIKMMIRVKQVLKVFCVGNVIISIFYYSNKHIKYFFVIIIPAFFAIL